MLKYIMLEEIHHQLLLFNLSINLVKAFVLFNDDNNAILTKNSL